MPNIFESKIEELEMQAAAAGGQAAGLSIDPDVSDDAKIVAYAIQQAGAQIAEALFRLALRS